jgi:hypothetical protein
MAQTGLIRLHVLRAIDMKNRSWGTDNLCLPEYWSGGVCANVSRSSVEGILFDGQAGAVTATRSRIVTKSKILFPYFSEVLTK